MAQISARNQARSSEGHSKSKIFVIGFNKCGTTSFHKMFQGSGISSVHWKTPEHEFVAARMFSNVSLRVDILEGLSEFQAFSDLFFLSGEAYLEANCLFRELHLQYPDAIFILNTRDRGRWLASRLNHTNAAVGSFGSRMERLLRVDERALTERWSRQWDQHHYAVRDYFSHNRNFLEFNIEQHEPNLLTDFLGSKGIAVDLNEWRRHNVTTQRRSVGRVAELAQPRY